MAATDTLASLYGPKPTLQTGQVGGQANAEAGSPPPTDPQQAAAPKPPKYQQYFGALNQQGQPPQAEMSAAASGAQPQAAPPSLQNGSYLNNLAAQFAQQAGAAAMPDTGGLKAQAREQAALGKQQSIDAAQQSAALRGTLQSGTEGATERRINDTYNGQVASAYNTIDTNAQQQAFQNLLQSSGALAGLGQNAVGNAFNQQQFGLSQELGRGNLGVAQGQLGVAQGGLDLQNRQFDTSTQQWNKQWDAQQQQAAQAAANAARNYDLQMANAQASQQSQYMDWLLGMMGY